MKSNVLKRIEEIIKNRIKKVPNSSLIQYTDTYVWLENENETFLEGFKKNYPREYQEEVDCIFDEIHPF